MPKKAIPLASKTTTRAKATAEKTPLSNGAEVGSNQRKKVGCKIHTKKATGMLHISGHNFKKSISFFIL